MAYHGLLCSSVYVALSADPLPLGPVDLGSGLIVCCELVDAFRGSAGLDRRTEPLGVQLDADGNEA